MKISNRFVDLKSAVLTYRKLSISDFYSAALRRRVLMDVYLPSEYEGQSNQRFPLVVFNDGQMLENSTLQHMAAGLVTAGRVPPFVLVAVHPLNRMEEYGVAGVPDYMNRGSRAQAYSRFIINECLPLMRKNFRLRTEPTSNAIAGFSLGALSAFDLCWNYPSVFGACGCFSGSFWWRLKGYEQGYDDQYDKIVHRMVRATDSVTPQRFWFQCGTEDEKADRNQNGQIDSIDDTLDLIAEMKKIGYSGEDQLRLHLVEGGRHELKTWLDAMPDFLGWLFKPV